MVRSNDGVFIEAAPVRQLSTESVEQLVEMLVALLESDPAQAEDSDLNDPENPSEPVVLEFLGLTKWKDFEKRALMYTLHRAGSSLHLHVTGRGADGMWSIADSSSTEFRLSENGEDACRQIASELIFRMPIMAPRVLGLPAPRMDKPGPAQD